MQRRYIASTLSLLVGVAGCSSAPPALELPRGALPGGTARITVNGNAARPLRAVQCTNIGKGLTEITIGARSTGVVVLLDSHAAKGVTFNDFGGFTGSYWQGLQGTAWLGMVDQTYTLTGTADGFSTEHPYVRTMSDYTVEVAC
jgi:ipoprotein LpqH